MNFQNPVRVSLGSHQEWKTRGTKRTIAEVSDDFMYIPIKDVLEQMLQNSDVIEEV